MERGKGKGIKLDAEWMRRLDGDWDLRLESGLGGLMGVGDVVDGLCTCLLRPFVYGWMDSDI